MHGKKVFNQALLQILTELELPVPPKLVIEEPKDPKNGDLATNAALLLAKQAKKSPLELAQIFARRLPEICPAIIRAEAVRPGFCNVSFSPQFWQEVIPAVEKAGANFGKSNYGQKEKVLVEYVSANPTGPLHVGHGRGAATGDSVAKILAAAGFDVSTEYYLNDAGRQMRLLGQSILLRAKELKGETINFPEDCYKGKYIYDLASEILQITPDLLSLPEAEALKICQKFGEENILANIKDDLNNFCCSHDNYFPESSLIENGAVDKTFKVLAESGRSFEKDGAIWFDTQNLEDDQNRVLRKSDGSLTYFATDIAYHHDKFQRGYTWLIDVWGADHHGYIPRMKAAIREMGRDPEKFSVLLIQLVNLMENGKPKGMSTRAGEFVTLADVINDVGTDAARFMFLSRSPDVPLDFDLELAKKRSLDNPVYYVQYAHARICALARRAEERGIILADAPGAKLLSLLTEPEELAILRQLDDFENTVIAAARNLAPHYITRWLMDLAAKLHAYYAKFPILQQDNLALSQARMALLKASGQALRNGLSLLGVSAPDAM